MKRIVCLLSLFCALIAEAQKVEMAVGDNWVEMPARQTQSELKPGWKIVDYQLKSRLVHYLWGGRASQLAEGSRPVFRVTPAEEEVLIDYAVMQLKRYRDYRKLPKAKVMDNVYMRLEPRHFAVKAEGEAFVCQPLLPLEAGEYVLLNLSQQPIGELGDLLVYPFSVRKE